MINYFIYFLFKVVQEKRMFRWQLNEKEATARAEALHLIGSEMPPKCELSKMEAVANKYHLEVPSSGTNEVKRRDLVGQFVLSKVLTTRELFCRERDKQFLIENSAPYRLLYWFYYSADLAKKSPPKFEKHQGQEVTIEVENFSEADDEVGQESEED
jgi:hypothetical protein